MHNSPLGSSAEGSGCELAKKMPHGFKITKSELDGNAMYFINQSFQASQLNFNPRQLIGRGNYGVT